MEVSRVENENFYRASLLALRALDARDSSARRFGADAEATWNDFRGHLSPSDRLDLLVRDGAVKWGAAFSPAQVFSLFGLAADDPFGPDWRSLGADAAKKLWSNPQVGDLASCAAALGISASNVPLPVVTPSTRLVVAGGAAILAVAQHFATDRGLRWSSQVLVASGRPAHRHLAGLVAPLLAAEGPTCLANPTADVAEQLRAAGFDGVPLAVTSTDATADELRFAQTAARK